MYEYKCEIVKIVDGDTIDVNIDLGFGTWIHNERIDSMELTHQNQEQETWKKRKEMVCTQKSVWKDSCQWVQNKF